MAGIDAGISVVGGAAAVADADVADSVAAAASASTFAPIGM